MIVSNSFEAIKERRLLFRGGFRRAFRRGRNGPQPTYRQPDASQTTRSKAEKKETKKEVQKEKVEKLNLVDATKELLDWRIGPDALKNHINEFLNNKDQQLDGDLKILKQRTGDLIKHYEEISAYKEGKAAEFSFKEVSAMEAALVNEVTEQFTSFDAVKKFAAELGLASQEAADHVSNQQEEPVLEESKSETNLEKNYDTFDEYLEALQKQAKSESETAEDSLSESLGDVPMQADAKVSQADKDLLDRLFVDFYEQDGKEETKKEMTDKEEEDKTEIQVEAKEQISLPDMKERISLSKRQYVEKCNSLVEKNKNCKTFGVNELDAMSADLSDMDEFMNAFDVDLAVAKDLSDFHNDSAFTRKVDALSVSIRDWRNYVQNMKPKLVGRKEVLIAERKEKEEKENAEREARELAEAKEQKELSEKKELALKRTAQVKDIRNNFSKSSKEISGRYNGRAKLDENNVRILKVDMDQFKLSLDVYRNTLNEVKELAIAGQAADLQGECEKLTGSADSWDAYTSNCIGKLEEMAAGMKAEREKQEKKEEARRLVEEKEKEIGIIAKNTGRVKGYKDEINRIGNDSYQKAEVFITVSDEELTEARDKLIEVSKYLEQVESEFGDVIALAKKHEDKEVSADILKFAETAESWKKYLSWKPDRLTVHLESRKEEAHIEDLETESIQRVAKMKEQQESAELHAESGNFDFEKPGDRLTAVLTGANGEKLQSFAKEGISESEYLAKFEKTITTADLYYKYEELFLDPSHPASPDAPKGDLRMRIRLIGKELTGVAEMERKIESEYGLTVISDSFNQANKRADLQSVRALERELGMLYTKLSEYPPEFVKNSNFDKIILVRNIKFVSKGEDGKEIEEGVGGYASHTQRAMVVNSVEWAFHHELLHLADAADGGYSNDDAEWGKSAYGEQYANIYKNEYSNNVATMVQKDKEGNIIGFEREYGTTNIDEDQATIAEGMIKDIKLMEARAKSDIENHNSHALQRKIEATMKFYARMSKGLINEDYWEAKRNGKSTGAEFWQAQREKLGMV